MLQVQDCTVVSDAKCGCPDGTNKTGSSTCTPIPGQVCNEGFESVTAVNQGMDVPYDLIIRNNIYVGRR